MSSNAQIETLPDGWSQGFDNQYKRMYYLNQYSKNPQWERPCYPAHEIPKLSCSVTPQANQTEPVFAEIIQVDMNEKPPPVPLIAKVQNTTISSQAPSTPPPQLRGNEIITPSFSHSMSSRPSTARNSLASQSSPPPSPLKDQLQDMDRKFNGPPKNKARPVIVAKKKRHSIFG